MSEPHDDDRHPLALRIRPQPSECFDSWIERVAAAHEVTRAGLFGHLKIDASWASRDLAAGRQGLARDLHRSFDEVVHRLAWAVAADGQTIRSTFVAVAPGLVLPRAMRRFACPRCWLDRRRDGRPAIIEKAWILRFSWRCDRHGLLLADLGHLASGGDGANGMAWLARVAQSCAKLDAERAYDETRLALNRYAVAKAAGTARGGMSRLARQYLAEFGENSWHLLASRTLMLASAHSHDPALVLATTKLFPFAETPRSYPPQPPDRREAVCASRLLAVIGPLHRQRCARWQAQLDSAAARLRQCRIFVAAYQARLDCAAALFARAWAERRDYRAAREGRDAIRQIVGVSLRRIRCERLERQSRAGSLASLREALRYARLAEARRAEAAGGEEPLLPQAWRLPSVSALERRIAEQERTAARAAAAGCLRTTPD